MVKVFKEFAVLLLVALAMIGVAIIPAYAASTPVFLGVSVVQGKGLVFLFDVAEDVNVKSLNISVSDGSKTHKLHCELRDDGKVACVLPGGLNKVNGEDVTINWNGNIYSVSVPLFDSSPPQFVATPTLAPVCEDSESCLVCKDTCLTTYNQAMEYCSYQDPINCGRNTACIAEQTVIFEQCKQDALTAYEFCQGNCLP